MLLFRFPQENSMKLSKYAAAFILFAVSIILNILLGASPELGLPGQYYMTMENSEHVDPLEMDAAAQRHNVILFTSYDRLQSELIMENTIYCSDENRNLLWDKYLGLKPGIIRNPIGRTYEVSAGSLADLKADSDALLCAATWFMIGKKEDCSAFVLEIKNKLHYAAISYVNNGDVKWAEHYFPHFILCFSLILLLLYCYLDSSFEKKEVAIRVLNGDSAWLHYIRISLTDTLIFSLIFAVCLAVQRIYTQMPRFYRNVYLLFIPFLIGIWIVNLHLLKIKPKEMVYGHQLSGHVLSLTSGLGKVAAVVSCAIILICTVMVPSLGRYRIAEEFFRDKSDFVYLDYSYDMKVSHRMLTDMDYMAEVRDMLRQMQEMIDTELEAVVISDETQVNEQTNRLWDPVYCNHNALPYLKQVYPEAAAIDLTNHDLAYLMPENLPATEQQKMRQLFTSDFDACEGFYPEENRIQYCTYQPGESLLCFTQKTNSKFRFVDLPVICIAANTYQRTEKHQHPANHDFLLPGTIFRCTDLAEMQRLMQDYPFEPVMTNIYEKFCIDYQIQKALLMMCLLIACLAFIFYISVMYTILKLDYQVNATELAIRKTLGESVFRKNQKHFTGAAAVLIVNLLLAVTASLWKHLLPLSSAIAVPVILFLLNILLIAVLIRRIEKQKITKILKGGAL